MANWNVPVTLRDGSVLEYPVQAETEEDARAAVEQAIASGQIKLPEANKPAAPQQEAPQSDQFFGSVDMHGLSPSAAQTGDALWIGMKKLGYNLMDFGLSVAAGLNPGQIYPEAEARLEQARKNIENARDEAMERSAAYFSEKHGGQKPSEFITMVGHELPLLPLAFSKLLQGSTFVRSALSNTGQGALYAAIAGSEDDDILGSAGWGALFGFGITAAFNSIPGIRSYIGRKYVEMQERGLAQRAQAIEERINADRVAQGLEPNFSFNVAQLGSDNPWLVGLARGSASRLTITQQRAQIQAIEDMLEMRASKLDPANVVADLHETMVSVSRRMHANARRVYQTATNYLYDNYGGTLVVEARNARAYAAAVDKAVTETQATLSLNAKPPPGLLQYQTQVNNLVYPYKIVPVTNKEGRLMYNIVRKADGEVVHFNIKNPDRASSLVDKLNLENGGLTAEQTVEVGRELNKLLTGESNMFDSAVNGSNEHIAKFLKSNWASVLRSTDSNGAKIINQANAAYEFEMQQIRTLRNSHLGKIFGEDISILETRPEDMLEAMLRLNPTSLRYARNVLVAEAPDVLIKLQGAAIRRMMQGGRAKAFTAPLGETDLDLLMGALSREGKYSNVGRAGQGLFTPKEQQELIDAGNALSYIRSTYARDVSKDTAGYTADVVINAVSQYAAFMARTATRMFARGETIERLLVDPAARRVLIQVAKEGPDTPAGRLAAVTLATLVGEADAEYYDENPLAAMGNVQLPPR